MKKIIDWVYLKDSNKKWNTTCIMVWVHGDEFAWYKALDEIIDKMEIMFGKVYFIYANLEAMKKNTRFTEKNLNRCFIKWNTWKTYEDKRSRQIMKYLDECDYLLDIHNTFNDINSKTFIISEYPELWKYFDIDYMISGFDKLHPWWSDSYMNSIWKKWVCIECGSIKSEDKGESIKLAKKSIKNFLKYMWNISWETQIYKKLSTINFDFIYKNESLDFKFIKDFKDFDLVNEWETIAFDWKKEIKARKDSYLLFFKNPEIILDECFCLWDIK